MKYKIIFFYFIFQINLGLAYVEAISSSGTKLKWKKENNELNILIDPRNTFNNTYNIKSEEEIEEIIFDSIQEWNQNSKIKLKVFSTNSLPEIGSNATIRFTQNTAFFGSGVLAITSISHDPSSDSILSADILINDSKNNNTLITSDPSLSSGSEYAYLGDIITHELGHLLGLAHTETFGSSMLFSVFKGQYSVASDDIEGVNNIYTSTNSGKKFKGKVIGKNSVPVFGAHVSLILESSGEVFASQLTDKEGHFYFNNLPIDDYFTLYISPSKSLTNLPFYFQSAQSFFCNGPYVPSFYTKCGGRSIGSPQIFSTTYNYDQIYDDEDNTYDLGEVSIKCNFDVDPYYLASKFQSDTYELFQFSNAEFLKYGIAGGTFVGKFSNEHIELELGDKLHFDYTELDQADGYFLDLKILTETIFSMLKLTVKVKNLVTGEVNEYQTSKDDITNRNLLNFHIKHPLSSNNLENDFEIIITPLNSENLSLEEQTEILASPSILKNDINSYYLSYTLGQLSEKGEQLFAIKKYKYPDDNKYCAQGNIGEAVRPLITNGSQSDFRTSGQNDDQNQLFSCATIDNDEGGNGRMSFLIGISLLLILAFIKESIFKLLSK